MILKCKKIVIIKSNAKVEQQGRKRVRRLHYWYFLADLGKTIGEGTFGKVKSATHKPTGQQVAIKIL